MGCTLFKGENELNAWIADIKDDTLQPVSDGLMIGLYVHKVNDEVINNKTYKYILNLIKSTKAPISLDLIDILH